VGNFKGKAVVSKLEKAYCQSSEQQRQYRFREWLLVLGTVQRVYILKKEKGNLNACIS